VRKNDAGEIEFGDELAEVVGDRMAGKSRDDTSSGLTSKIPKRHSNEIITKVAPIIAVRGYRLLRTDAD
jgi:hypothetical protein